MKFIDEYIDRINSSPPEKYLVYTTERHNFISKNSSYVGGFADRIKGIITSYLIAVKLNRIFVIDWRSPFSLQPTLKPNAYDWTPERWGGKIGGFKSILQIDVIDDLAMILDANVRHLEKAIFLNADVIFMNTNSFNWEFAEQLAGEKGAQVIFHAAYKSLFSFSMPDNMADLLLEVENRRSKKGSLVGMHFRTGDGNGWVDQHMSPWSDFQTFVSLGIDLAHKLGQKDPAIYFASDSQRAKDASELLFADKGLFVSRREIGHIDRSDLNDRTSFDYAVAEFHILSNCDLIIGRKGGYYGTAAMVGGKPCYTV